MPHEFYSSIRTLRSFESIQASIMVEFNEWRESGVVERQSRQAANALGERGKRSRIAERDGQSIVHESGHGVQNVALDVVKTLTHKRVRQSISFRSRRVR